MSRTVSIRGSNLDAIYCARWVRFRCNSTDSHSVVFRTETDKTARLAALGFNVIPHLICETVDIAVSYFRDIANTRDSLPFWIDGVVMKIDDIGKQDELGVVSGKPKGQVAWKFDSVGAETVLEGVVVTGGHNGVLYPTAQLRPVEIGGTTVSNASLAKSVSLRFFP